MSRSSGNAGLRIACSVSSLLSLSWQRNRCIHKYLAPGHSSYRLFILSNGTDNTWIGAEHWLSASLHTKVVQLRYWPCPTLVTLPNIQELSRLERSAYHRNMASQGRTLDTGHE